MSMAIKYHMKKRMAKGGHIDDGKTPDEKRAARSERHPISVSGGPGRQESRRGVPHLNQEGTGSTWSQGKSLGHHLDTVRGGGETRSRKMEAEENLDALKKQSPNLKGLAEGGPVDGYQSECTEHCEYPCMVHPEFSGYESMPEDHEKHNEAAIDEDDMVGHIMAKKFAEGGNVKGVNTMSHSRSEHSAGKAYAEYKKPDGNYKHLSDEQRAAGAERNKQFMMKTHKKALEEQRAMPAPNLKGLAEGGEVEADFDENDFEQHPDDSFDFHDTAENSGDELGNEFDADHEDMVGKIMMKRRKDKNPKPA